jgi:hypothetical protein
MQPYAWTAYSAQVDEVMVGYDTRCWQSFVLGMSCSRIDLHARPPDTFPTCLLEDQATAFILPPCRRKTLVTRDPDPHVSQQPCQHSLWGAGEATRPIYVVAAPEAAVHRVGPRLRGHADLLHAHTKQPSERVQKDDYVPGNGPGLWAKRQ